MISREDALKYHSSGRKGKLEVVASKPCATQRDLSLAYTPGVAQPCLAIADNKNDVYEYTAKGNLVAVISNGTAVLGLGDIGPEAGKPVMEGKGVLFKRFADVDVYDIEVDSKDPKEIIKFCKMISPTFGGINLEDIKAPECFEIEEALIEALDIPVFHDDQHGTAIISGAAMLNALELVKKDIDKVKCVFLGAGAAGIACATLYVALGVNPANVRMCDSKGVIYKGRAEGMNKYKEQFAVETDERTLEDAMKGADVFVGVAVKDMVTKDMVRSMANQPIIFAMANPDPEITYDDAKAARDDIIMATGRSDYPNQVNNVLGFPFIFRGALDVNARKINMEMKIAAVKALANLAKEQVPESVSKAYGGEHFKFGPEYIIPKPFDPRVLIWEATAVAQAAMDTGVARRQIDIEEYKTELENRLGATRWVMRQTISRAKANPRRVVYPEGENEKIIRAARIIASEKIAVPILLGHPEVIEQVAEENGISLDGIEVIQPRRSPNFDRYAKEYLDIRCRKGVTKGFDRKAMLDTNFFGTMMVELGDADCIVSGVSQHYPDTLRPALQILKSKNKYSTVCGIYVMMIKNRTFFFSDCTVNIDPTPDEMVDIALMTAQTAKHFNVEPRIAMISFSNFGSVRTRETEKVVQATEILKAEHPELIVEGEMQADTAVAPYISERDFPFATIKGDANCLIFPTLDAGSVAYKLMMQLGGAEVIGPILQGMKKPVHILHRATDVDGIVNMTAIAAVDSLYA